MKFAVFGPYPIMVSNWLGSFDGIPIPRTSSRTGSEGD